MNLPLLIISAVLGAIALLCGILSFQVKQQELGQEESKVLPIAFFFFVLFAIGVSFVASIHQNVKDFSEILENEFFPLYLIVSLVFLVGALVISGAYKKPGLTVVLGGLCLGIAIGVTIFNGYWITLLVVLLVFTLGHITTRFTETMKKTV